MENNEAYGQEIEWQLKYRSVSAKCLHEQPIPFWHVLLLGELNIVKGFLRYLHYNDYVVNMEENI